MTAGWDLQGGHRGGRDGPLVKGCPVDTAGTRFGYHGDAPWVSQGCPVCTTKPLQAPSHQGAAAEGVEGRNKSLRTQILSRVTLHEEEPVGRGLPGPFSPSESCN